MGSWQAGQPGSARACRAGESARYRLVSARGRGRACVRMVADGGRCAGAAPPRRGDGRGRVEDGGGQGELICVHQVR
eukprot:scaffold2109_cov123-Isochrysis_galbana.AAC.9